jgi:hypothetical protein
MSVIKRRKDYMGFLIHPLTLTILSAIIAPIIVEIVKNYISNGFVIQLTGVPNVKGRYKAIYPDNIFPSETVMLKQFGSMISGTIDDHKLKDSYTLKGFVTTSRLISYQFTPKNRNNNNYGTCLLRLDRKGKCPKGYITYIAATDNELKTISVTFEKIR